LNNQVQGGSLWESQWDRAEGKDGEKKRSWNSAECKRGSRKAGVAGPERGISCSAEREGALITIGGRKKGGARVYTLTRG